jgi:outer membrane receptor for monomeric catechols
MHTLTDVATFKVEHDFSDAVTIQNQARYARYSRDFRFRPLRHYDWDWR